MVMQKSVRARFYVFSAGEVDALMGEDADVVRRRFGVEPTGNALADPQGEFFGLNLLYIAQSIEEVSVRTGRDVESVMRVLRRARKVLFDARATRPRPHLDDKILTAWNGLMIGRLGACRASDGGQPAPVRMAHGGPSTPPGSHVRISGVPPNESCSAAIALAKRRSTPSAKTTPVWRGD
jgi:uncharacterized protein YyaL (SSP411 family)